MAITFKKKTWKDAQDTGTAITPSELNRLETAINSLVTAVNSLQNSLDTYDTLYSDASWWITCHLNIVTIHANGVKTGSGYWDSVKCSYTLPAAYRPEKKLFVPMLTENGASWTGAMIVDTTGTITVQNYGNAGSTDSRSGIISYPIKAS